MWRNGSGTRRPDHHGQHHQALRLPRLGLLSVVLLAVAALPAWAQKAIENNQEAPKVPQAQAGVDRPVQLELPQDEKRGDGVVLPR